MHELCNAVGGAVVLIRLLAVNLQELSKSYPSDDDLHDLLDQSDPLLDDLQTYHARLRRPLMQVNAAEFNLMFDRVGRFQGQVGGLLTRLLPN